MNRQWKERNCRNCKIQLGCPHSKLAGNLAIEPTNDMKPPIMKSICANHKIRENE